MFLYLCCAFIFLLFIHIFFTNILYQDKFIALLKTLPSNKPDSYSGLFSSQPFKNWQMCHMLKTRIVNVKTNIDSVSCLKSMISLSNKPFTKHSTSTSDS